MAYSKQITRIIGSALIRIAWSAGSHDCHLPQQVVAYLSYTESQMINARGSDC